MQNLGKNYKFFFLISNIIGIIVGVFMIVIAIDHNPQGEYINIYSGNINYISLLFIFLSWYILSVLIVYGVFFGIKLMSFLFNKLKV